MGRPVCSQQIHRQQIKQKSYLRLSKERRSETHRAACVPSSAATRTPVSSVPRPSSRDLPCLPYTLRDIPAAPLPCCPPCSCMSAALASENSVSDCAGKLGEAENSLRVACAPLPSTETSILKLEPLVQPKIPALRSAFVLRTVSYGSRAGHLAAWRACSVVIPSGVWEAPGEHLDPSLALGFPAPAWPRREIGRRCRAEALGVAREPGAAPAGHPSLRSKSQELSGPRVVGISSLLGEVLQQPRGAAAVGSDVGRIIFQYAIVFI